MQKWRRSDACAVTSMVKGPHLLPDGHTRSEAIRFANQTNNTVHHYLAHSFFQILPIIAFCEDFVNEFAVGVTQSDESVMVIRIRKCYNHQKWGGSAMERLLLVEDDPTLIRMLTGFLATENFQVESVIGQSAAVEAMEAGKPDLALVDISLAEGNGFAVCATAKELSVPVIFLTASSDEFSVVTGLDMGADDYISKPFRPRELVSRIRSVLRRAGSRQSTVVLGDLLIDTDKGTVTRNGQDLYLSALEYKLLLVFLNNRGQILSRDKLLEEIWDSAGDYVEDNTLTVYIKRLREKIEVDPQNPAHIKTIRGLGYRLEG